MSELPIAVRVYPDLKPTQPERKAPQIDGMLVFDCETRTDRAQALTFGSYRFLVAGRCLEEGLFYADDLAAAERTVLERYAREHAADTDPRGIPERGIPSNPNLMLLPIADFRKLLYRVGYKGRGLLCAFNFPFDASRCALGYVESRDRFLGGFTFQFFQYCDRNGQSEYTVAWASVQSALYTHTVRLGAMRRFGVAGSKESDPQLEEQLPDIRRAELPEPELFKQGALNDTIKKAQ